METLFFIGIIFAIIIFSHIHYNKLPKEKQEQLDKEFKENTIRNHRQLVSLARAGSKRLIIGPTRNPTCQNKSGFSSVTTF